MDEWLTFYLKPNLDLNLFQVAENLKISCFNLIRFSVSIFKKPQNCKLNRNTFSLYLADLSYLPSDRPFSAMRCYGKEKNVKQ